MKKEDVIRKYNLDIEILKDEQLRLKRKLNIHDSRDFSDISLIAGVDSEFDGNRILSVVSVVDNEFSIVDQSYTSGKTKFPYISEFRAYRELPIILEAFNKLDEKPELVFIKAHGTAHPRLGLASQFSLSTGIPTIGVSESLLAGELSGEKIVIDGRVVGMVFESKKGSKPLYVSPGDLISVQTAFKLCKKFIKYPHKLPEPLHIASKYGKKMRGELYVKND